MCFFLQIILNFFNIDFSLLVSICIGSQGPSSKTAACSSFE